MNVLSSDSEDDVSSIENNNKNLKANKVKEGGKDEEFQFKINEKYASNYNKKKRAEELLNYNHGDDDDMSYSSSDASSEDEDARLLTNDLELKILKTIHTIQAKKDEAYDREKKFFDDDDIADDVNKKQNGKDKKKHYKDIIREQVLEDMKNDGDHQSNSKVEKQSKMEYDAEQKELRREFLSKDGDEDNDTDDEEFLNIKEKSDEIDGDLTEEQRKEVHRSF